MKGETMEKISSNKVAAVISTVPGMLRGLARERDGLMQKVAQLEKQVNNFERRDRITEMAKKAHERHLNALGDTEEEKIASIEEALQKGKSLDVMEEAIKMSSLDGSIAYLTGDEMQSAGSSELEQYLLSSI
jgi:chorismate mutase